MPHRNSSEFWQPKSCTNRFDARTCARKLECLEAGSDDFLPPVCDSRCAWREKKITLDIGLGAEIASPARGAFSIAHRLIYYARTHGPQEFAGR